MKRSFCRTRLGHVHCVEAGTDAGTPLLLLHQTPRSVDEFAEVIPLLARTRRVIAIDTPGYGCSDPVAGEPSIADYAGATLDVLDSLGIPRVIAVGHHTGGFVAIEIAAAAPERVAGCVISGPVYTDAAGRAALAPYFVQWLVQPDGSHLLDKWHKLHAWLPRTDLVQRCVVDLFRAGEASEQGHFAVASYRMEDRLPLVRCPGLLLYSRRDPFSAPERSEPFRRAFRPARELTIDAGIFCANENPQAFADAVLTWSREAVPAG